MRNRGSYSQPDAIAPKYSWWLEAVLYRPDFAGLPSASSTWTSPHPRSRIEDSTFERSPTTTQTTDRDAPLLWQPSPRRSPKASGLLPGRSWSNPPAIRRHYFLRRSNSRPGFVARFERRPGRLRVPVLPGYTNLMKLSGIHGVFSNRDYELGNFGYSME